MSARLWLWGPVVAHMALIFILSSFSKLPGPPGGLSDKHVHALAFGLLAALWLRARAGGRAGGVSLPAVAEAVGAAVVWGALDEFHQRFVPGRTADLADLAADAAGAVCATVVIWACAIIAQSARRSTGRRASR